MLYKLTDACPVILSDPLPYYGMECVVCGHGRDWGNRDCCVVCCFAVMLFLIVCVCVVCRGLFSIVCVCVVCVYMYYYILQRGWCLSKLFFQGGKKYFTCPHIPPLLEH